MRVPAEEVIGLGIIALLLWYAFKHRQNVTVINKQVPKGVSSPNTVAPGFYAQPPAPNLNGLILPQPTKFDVIINGGGTKPPTTPIVTSPAPCTCACNDGGSSQITQIASDFSATLAKSMGVAFDGYIKSLTNQIPSWVQQYFVNPAQDNANKIAAAGEGQSSKVKLQGLSFTQHTDYATQGGYVGAGGGLTDKDEYSIASYTPGRLLSFR